MAHMIAKVNSKKILDLLTIGCNCTKYAKIEIRKNEINMIFDCGSDPNSDVSPTIAKLQIPKAIFDEYKYRGKGTDGGSLFFDFYQFMHPLCSATSDKPVTFFIDSAADHQLFDVKVFQGKRSSRTHVPLIEPLTFLDDYPILEKGFKVSFPAPILVSHVDHSLKTGERVHIMVRNDEVLVRTGTCSNHLLAGEGELAQVSGLNTVEQINFSMVFSNFHHPIPWCLSKFKATCNLDAVQIRLSGPHPRTVMIGLPFCSCFLEYSFGEGSVGDPRVFCPWPLII